MGVGEDVLHPALLRHHAAVQNGHPGADLLDDAHLVGDDHHGDPQLLIQVLQQVQDGGGGGGVQGGGGLVAQQDLGVRGQGPGDGHPLLLSAGELGGIGVGLFRQPHQVQQLQGPLFGLGGGDAADLHGEADVFQAGPLHQQVEALEDHGDLPAGQPQLLLAEGRHLLPIHDHRAGGGPLQQVHAPHQGALAGAGETNDPEDLPLLNVQIDVLQGMDGALAGAEGLVQMLNLDD